MLENRGLQALEDRVIRKDLCTLCGACAFLCPYLRVWKGRWVKLHDCDLAEGRCVDYCPRMEVNLDAIHRGVFGEAYHDVEMGLVRRVLMARATDPELRQMAQTGGVVSALMDFAMSEGVLDATVLTSRDVHHLPQGRVVRSREEILSCIGSSYVAGPTLEALNREPLQSAERIGVVGVPCQVLALAKMRVSNMKKFNPIDRVRLVVGLFCTWALKYQPFMDFIKEQVNGAQIRKMDITAPPERLLKVITCDKTCDIPMDKIRPFILPTCGICLDMTAEFSDISVGTVEGTEKWNTVVIRTGLGEGFLNQAEAAGVLEIRPLPEENLQHLKKASLLKKRRALMALKERGEMEGGYLVLSPEIVQRIMSEVKEVVS